MKKVSIGKKELRPGTQTHGLQLKHGVYLQTPQIMAEKITNLSALSLTAVHIFCPRGQAMATQKYLCAIEINMSPV